MRSEPSRAEVRPFWFSCRLRILDVKNWKNGETRDGRNCKIVRRVHHTFEWFDYDVVVSAILCCLLSVQTLRSVSLRVTLHCFKTIVHWIIELIINFIRLYINNIVINFKLFTIVEEKKI